MNRLQDSFSVPIREAIADKALLLTQPWQEFFRFVQERLSPLGAERSFAIENNKSAAMDVVGLKFDSRQTSQAVIECLIQRVTTGVGATELVEFLILSASYMPASDDWELDVISHESPDDSGVTLSITSAGQVQYQSSNVTGTPSISRLIYRIRTLSGKSAQYSAMAGGR